jgi:tRNA wybutosine-synthesizing protein 4
VFRSLSKFPKASRACKFIDVDFLPLSRRKADIINQTEELRSYVAGHELGTDQDAIVLRSQHYCIIGCDLGHLRELESHLAEVSDLEEDAVLFIAEVSLTYMLFEAADEVIKWASSIPHCQWFRDTELSSRIWLT